jgi:hypothetical protein
VKEYALANKLMGREPDLGKKVDQYYSVEFSFEALGVIYQFKIWETASTVMSVLVKENSRILPWLKVGDKLNMKYYSTDLVYPIESLNSEICYITKQDQGRLRGHYLVGIEILESQDRNNAYWPYLSNKTRVLPFNKSLRDIHIGSCEF